MGPPISQARPRSLNNCRFNLTNNARPKRIVYMKMKPMILAGIAAALLSGGSGVAAADPGPTQPDPNGPKCWGWSDTGYTHWAYTPCGWTYSDAGGWQQEAPPPAP
jgi:hypothetical protein